VVGVVGTVVSNIVTLPVSATGGVCSDPQFGISGTQISTLNGQSTVNTGTLIVEQSTSSLSGTPTTQGIALAEFEKTTAASYAGSSAVSLGGCLLDRTRLGNPY